MDAVAKDILRQIGTDANTRFLRRMPQFKVEPSMPQRMTQLLNELERLESTDERAVARAGGRNGKRG